MFFRPRYPHKYIYSYSTDLNTLITIRVETAMVEQRWTEVNSNKNFTYETQVTKKRMVQLMEDEYVTNCLECTLTCHHPCKESNKRNEDCDVMDPSTGNCSVCPLKCHWKKHERSQHRYETYIDTEKKTLEILKLSHRNTIHGALTADTLVEAFKTKYAKTRSQVVDLLREAHQKLCILDEIALKANPMTITDYIDMLSGSEEFQKKSGWAERVRILQEILRDVELEINIKERTRIEAKKKDGSKSTISSNVHGFEKVQHHHLIDNESTGTNPQESHVSQTQASNLY